MIRTVLVLVTVVACSAERQQSVYLPSAVEHSVAPIDASLLPPPRPGPPAHACVMLYECGCNASCTEIDHPLASLTAGMQVGVVSGPLSGTTVFVARNRADDGTRVFTVQRSDPKDDMMCGVQSASPLIGYRCITTNLGAARACTSCDL